MSRKTVVLITREGLGCVAPEDYVFGLEMMEKFLHTLESQAEKPQAICFYTEGVKLVCQGSEVLPSLQLLAGMGVKLVACQTCLDYYRLSEKVAVGGTGGMKEIQALLLEADSVLTV